MRRLAWLLTFALVCSFPHPSLADSHRLSDHLQYSSSCGIQARDDDAAANRALRCTAGVAVRVFRKGMKVRPVNGNLLQVRFTGATVFETESGEGVLDGLVARDYVCVTYMPRPGTVIARFVVFDPKSIPCGSRKQGNS